jgi:2-(3-amino-3-carboxypropyl)histidine synthase
MKQKNLADLEKDYELELEKAVATIRKEKPKRVLLQFPDGFKIYGAEIQKKLEKMLGKQAPEFFLWFDSCFGACDIPLETKNLGIELIIQFGHSNWDYSNKRDIKVLS